MKILHIVPTYFPAHKRGGPIASVHSLNKWIAKKGADVTVYTTDLDIPDGAVPRGKETSVDGAKVWYFPLTWRPWQYSFAMHRALARNVKNFDLVHLTSTFLSASTLGAYYARKYRVPYLISPRGNLMKEPLRKGIFKNIKKWIYLSLIEKRNLAGAVAIDFTVEKERDEYIARALPLRRSIVIPNGLELDPENISDAGRALAKKEFSKRYGVSETARIVLFLGRITWIKGLDTLIPAFANVVKEEPAAILIIAGPDEEGYRKTVQSLIAARRLQDRVIFTGLLTGKEKIGAFHASDVFVLPSYSESFGMAVIEAIHYGVPAIVTKNVGVAPNIERMSAGMVVSKEVQPLTEAILRILKDAVSAARMRERGRVLVAEEFNAARIAERWIETYNELAHNEQR